ncbi:carbon-monoxide dehydrogenase small subunit [Haloarcula vallismortis]|uniref:Isoquinoline 1-oxidoreductase alpha subunit n=2 Tax=Haloarcula vallismortis TaxID=28442 RepID=M0JCY0_HALVA|nr:(2Fe-2S)-binding protein [Haloarcula vallismortis]EMA05505.1 isoquinoline 1-oxidoreductase alpha subunit [Haloarcula vallismortis ATCC 29715]SDW87118.1 carbon-monoxide dehydrogenase small subunit [Haloarcula vallismortis]
MEIELELNGVERTVEASKSDSLLDVLRRNGYTGAKRGCDTGACGFCTVRVDGEPVKSCVKPVTTVQGAAVETIEGLGTQDDLHPVQQAFVDNTALQCGFCIPGMIMRSTALLEENPAPTEQEVREALSDNLCRCTGYKKIVAAVLDAAEQMDDGTAVATDGGPTLNSDSGTTAEIECLRTDCGCMEGDQ